MYKGSGSRPGIARDERTSLHTSTVRSALFGNRVFVCFLEERNVAYYCGHQVAES